VWLSRQQLFCNFKAKYNFHKVFRFTKVMGMVLHQDDQDEIRALVFKFLLKKVLV